MVDKSLGDLSDSSGHYTNIYKDSLQKDKHLIPSLVDVDCKLLGCERESVVVDLI